MEVIERIYIFPTYEIEKYRVSNDEELKKANKFWDEIINIR